MMTTGTVQIEGGNLYYEIGGSGGAVPGAARNGDAVVLCHAGFVDHRQWDAQWPALTQRFRVLRYDLRGFGRSDAIHGPFDPVEDLAQLMQHLEIERAALVGCSYGGELVIDFALQYPEKVTGLVPVSTVPTGFELQGEPPEHMFEMIEALQQGDTKRATELQMRLWVDGQFRRPDEVDLQVRQSAAEMTRTSIERSTFFQMEAPRRDPPAIQRLGEIAVPTLIIAGALDHPEILRAAYEMATQIPRARKVILPNSAHLPNMEQPAAFNKAVLDFLTVAVGMK